jgi:hypothetical protein
MNTNAKWIFMLLFSIVVFSCEKEDEDVISIVFPKSDEFIDGIGNSVKLTPEARNSEGKRLSDKKFEWFASDNEIASVDENGIVSSRGLGFTTIEARSGNISGSVNIHVCSCVVDRFSYDMNGNIISFSRKDTICNQLTNEFFNTEIDFDLALENNIIAIDSKGRIIMLHHKTCGY